MPQRDLFSFTLMITVYIRNEELEKARKVFNLLGFDDRKDPACWNALIAGYAKKRRFDEAKRLLDEMPVKNLVSWNSMLAGYTKNGEMELGLQFFEEMELAFPPADSSLPFISRRRTDPQFWIEWSGGCLSCRGGILSSALLLWKTRILSLHVALQGLSTSVNQISYQILGLNCLNPIFHNLKLKSVDKRIVTWIIRHYDYTSHSLILPDGKVCKLTVDDVRNVYYLPKGPEDVTSVSEVPPTYMILTSDDNLLKFKKFNWCCILNESMQNPSFTNESARFNIDIAIKDYCDNNGINIDEIGKEVEKPNDIVWPPPQLVWYEIKTKDEAFSVKAKLSEAHSKSEQLLVAYSKSMTELDRLIASFDGDKSGEDDISVDQEKGSGVVKEK
ncbi:Pentatricopeptide repeat-containing protein At4g02750 [Linum perenne]